MRKFRFTLENGQKLTVNPPSVRLYYRKYATAKSDSALFKTIAEAIGLMANSGIKASQAGTSLRRILTEMSHDIQLNGEKIGQFVVKTTTADGSMRNLSDILADLRVGWNKLSESEQAANATLLLALMQCQDFLHS